MNLTSLQSHLSGEAYKNLCFWRDHYPEFSNPIETLIKEKRFKELEDAFYMHVEIGTGGIRGTLGTGPNRINTRIIGEAAQGLCEFIKDFGPQAMQKGIVVGYEARKQSQEFARLCCEVFAANGIHSFLFDGLRSTPEISFAVRHLSTTAGVQITASHNPRTDNGFKFYWSDGGQVIPPLDVKFMELVKQVKEIRRMNVSIAKQKGLITMIGKEVDDEYIAKVKSCSLVNNHSATIVFSPIHGAGITNVLPVLEQSGFKVTLVPEQATPDENFPTAKGDLINPEYPEVMELPIALAEKLATDLAINSDPDADRIGVAAKISLGSNKLQFLTGNEVGIGLTHFILSRLKEQGKLKPTNVVIETNVTTTLIADIARSFDIQVVDDLLVGFKFIAQTIAKLPDENDFIFAAEESLGYLAGNFVRDKDGAIASLLLAQMVSWLKDRDKTLPQYLDDIYQEYGYYKNILQMVEMKGKQGFLDKRKTMLGFRFNPPSELGGHKIIKIFDRLPAQEANQEAYKAGGAKDQIAYMFSEDGRTKVTLRPSGTEPKLKYYIQCYQPIKKDLETIRKHVDKVAKELLQAIMEEEKRAIHTKTSS